MRYPQFLSEGGRIGFIAPSFGCATQPYLSDFEDALENLKNMGYKTILGPNCLLDNGIGISNIPEKCADEANDFLINDRSDVIISCGGGELMCEILPFIDFEKISLATPKWFMGYSDNTNLTFLLNTLCDTASVYSVCASKFTKEHHQCVDDAFDFLCGRKLSASNYDKWMKKQREITDDEDAVSSEDIKPIDVFVNEKTGDLYDVFAYRQYIYIGDKKTSSVKLSGRLIGGCLDCLATLVGTRFDRTAEFIDRYKDDGIVWFLESSDLTAMGVRRALWQMENAGWFKHVKGFLIGRPLLYDDSFGDFGQRDAVLGILGKYNVPILMDLDIGHQYPQMPIISGSYIKAEAYENTFKIDHILS